MSPAGDEWETLYRKHGRKVLHVATLAAGGSAHNGWDDVQHAFSQAWLHLTDPSKPPVGNWAGWLRKAAVRHVVEAAKGETRALPLLDRDRQQDGPLLESWVAVKEEYQGILKAVAALPARQRQAMALCCIAGFSVKETALIMDIEDGTVRSLISQARQALPPRRGEETGDEQ